MLLFHNPGLIPVDAIRLMGASVKTPGAFGRFGTGFKYGVATVLRGGGTIRIWRGVNEMRFELREVEMKGQTFEEVVLVNPAAELVADTFTPLGFTTALGKDWEPWMVLREFACNARDEGGDFKLIAAGDVPSCFSAKDNETVIIIQWPELDAAAEDGEAGVFAPDVPELAEEHGVRVLPGPSPYLYHRGVRVWKLPKPSVFTYDITAPVDLTEDRTVKYAFCVVANVRNALLQMEDREVIRGAVTAEKGKTWEGGFDWAGEEWSPAQPGAAWLEVVAEARNIGGMGVNESARNVLLKHKAFREAQSATWTDMEGVNEGLSEAAEVIEELGFDLKDVNVFITATLPGNALSAVNNGNIFVTRELLDARVVVIVRELLRRLMERESGGDHDKLLSFALERLFELVLKGDFRLRREKDLFMEEAKAGSVADMLLIAMDVRGEEFPARPSELTPPPAPSDDEPF